MKEIGDGVLANFAGEGGKGTRGGVTRVERIDDMKGGKHAPIPSARWAENTIVTECMQEGDHRQSMYSL